ncbi:MAG: hypothetical protein HYW07_25045 [Candidatus Latescibacteria bacterium]|nr:hypothetical protein [Candidatus Latescibacterota bacterium]
MPPASSWSPVEADLKTILKEYPDPLRALAEARVPAFILRRAYAPAHCQGLIRRFIERGLMRDPQDTSGKDTRNRIDIGTSLGNLGGNQEHFLQHAEGTHQLFAHLFDGFDNPVQTLYTALQALALSQEVKVAREPDGRRYGPAIFRIHYTGHTYRPHIDHVVLREERFNYAVSRFAHQFAGVLCFQNASAQGESTQAILHQCLWTPQIQPHIAAQTFPQYAAENHLAQCRVELEPGDLYFFNTRCIHEVPPVQGGLPRIVLASFIGYGPEHREVFVWS